VSKFLSKFLSSRNSEERVAAYGVESEEWVGPRGLERSERRLGHDRRRFIAGTEPTCREKKGLARVRREAERRLTHGLVMTSHRGTEEAKEEAKNHRKCCKQIRKSSMSASLGWTCWLRKSERERLRALLRGKKPAPARKTLARGCGFCTGGNFPTRARTRGNPDPRPVRVEQPVIFPNSK
jgi:hypothetical protein